MEFSEYFLWPFSNQKIETHWSNLSENVFRNPWAELQINRIVQQSDYNFVQIDFVICEYAFSSQHFKYEYLIIFILNHLCHWFSIIPSKKTILLSFLFWVKWIDISQHWHLFVNISYWYLIYFMAIRLQQIEHGSTFVFKIFNFNTIHHPPPFYFLHHYQVSKD